MHSTRSDVVRVLGLDFGDKTIGVAVSDPFGWTAQGLETIRREEERNLKKSLERIKEIIEDYKIGAIVLGYPKNMNNTEGIRCEKTLFFEQKLKLNFPGKDIILWDERLSTMAAGRALLEADMSRGKRKKVIDKMAAVVILQGYLDSSAREG